MKINTTALQERIYKVNAEAKKKIGNVKIMKTSFIKIKKLLIAIFVHFYLCFFSQSKPPESYSLIRGVNENINLNTGSIDLSLPILEVTNGSFTLKNVLNYESRGFVPHISSNYVGLNWSLLQFGKITREARRIDVTFASNILSGFASSIGPAYDIPYNYARYDAIKIVFPDIDGNKTFKKDLYNNPYSKDYYAKMQHPTLPGYFGQSKNFDPDKFYFDFMGYKGYFIIDNEGQAIIYSENSSLKININNYGFHDLFGNITYSEIQITDDKGNQYFFGGETNALDINYSFNRLMTEDYNYYGYGDNFIDRATKTNYIDGWLLNKIIFANGKQVEAFYQPQDISVLNDFRGDMKLINLFSHIFDNDEKIYESQGFPEKQTLINANLTVNHIRTFNEKSGLAGACIPSCYINLFRQIDTYSKQAVLDSIKFDNVTVSYKYTLTPNPLELTNKYLNEINVKYNNKPIQKVNLSYETYGLTNKRVFLKNVTTTNNGDFSFDYHNTENFPPLKNSDLATNILGYWTGDMFPKRQNGNQIIEDFTKFNAGLLKKIIYPTKGSTSYFYELGDYSKKFTYEESGANYYPSLIDENKSVNAPRLLKKIESGLSTTRETIYTYKDGGGLSSGIVDDSKQEIGAFTSTKNMSENLNTTNSLRYSSVSSREIGNGFKKYFFTDRISNPDSLTSKVFHKPNSCSVDYKWLERNRIYLSKSNERGKILREEFFNENSVKTMENVYKYSNFLQKLPIIDATGNINSKVSDLNYYVRMIEYGSFTCQIQTIYIPVLPYLLTSQTSTQYFNSKKMETTKSITYNNNYFVSSNGFRWHPYPVEESLLTTTGNTTKKYLYSFDLQKLKPIGCTRGCDNVDDDNLFGSQYATYDRMNNLNIISNPALTINETNNKYNLTENLFYDKPTIYKRKIRQSSLDTILDFVNFKSPSLNSSTVITYNNYDNMGNLIQETSKDGIPTTTIWGYHQSLPIAIIKGATYSQVMNAFNLTSVDSNSYLQLDIVNKSNDDIDGIRENLLLKYLDDFRIALASFQVYTYTYDPLIGVTSITPPSGVRQNYHYDSANRLSKIVDVNQNILKEYKYNYAPVKYFSTERSKTYYKECGSSDIGSSHLYVVPANKYASLISQSDADQLALNDINANGQIFANTNGACRPPISCSVSMYFSGGGGVVEKNTGYYKATVSFSTGANSTTLPWQTGVKIGTIQGVCKPSTNINSYNGQVYYTINTNGDIIIKKHSSTPYSNFATLNFEFTYSIN